MWASLTGPSDLKYLVLSRRECVNSRCRAWNRGLWRSGWWPRVREAGRLVLGQWQAQRNNKEEIEVTGWNESCSSCNDKQLSVQFFIYTAPSGCSLASGLGSVKSKLWVMWWSVTESQTVLLLSFTAPSKSVLPVTLPYANIQYVILF